MPAKRRRPLWRCPKCGATFVTRNLWHSCGKHSLAAHFARSEPHVLPLFRRFAAMVRACGPVRMYVQKTRIVFQARVRFAGAVPRKSHLQCAVALPERRPHPRFTKIESFLPHFHGHHFRISSLKELDTQVARWLRAAYRVGQQEHLPRSERPVPIPSGSESVRPAPRAKRS